MSARGLRLAAAVTVLAGVSVGASGAGSTTPAVVVPAAIESSGAHAPGTGREAKPRPADAAGSFSAAAWSATDLGTLNPSILELALGAARCAAAVGAVEAPATLTIIDYSRASTEPRLWVLDLQRGRLLYEELVSHGQGSGGNFATAFSNTPDSHQTSLGLFVTDDTYVGRNGYSLRLNGLEPGVNDRARERAIVMHGAPYVNAGITRSLGRLGRSHGCPAVREPVARELIDRVKGGGLLFAYYPDPSWLDSSRFLNRCPSVAAGE